MDDIIDFAPIRYWDCPGNCKGHDPDSTTAHITLPDLRQALDRFITTGKVDEDMYAFDATYHAIIHLIKRGK